MWRIRIGPIFPVADTRIPVNIPTSSRLEYPHANDYHDRSAGRNLGKYRTAALRCLINLNQSTPRRIRTEPIARGYITGSPTSSGYTREHKQFIDFETRRLERTIFLWTQIIRRNIKRAHCQVVAASLKKQLKAALNFASGNFDSLGPLCIS